MARAHVVAPELDPAYDHLTLSELRLLRQRLSEEESRISYWRRIIQARIDVNNSTTPKKGRDLVGGLGRILVDAHATPRRLAAISVKPIDQVAPLPDLAELWERIVDPNDEAAMAKWSEELLLAESELSQLRVDLHCRIDEATGQLIARYHTDPSQALSTLPLWPPNPDAVFA
jgi:hypothetical protein